MTKAKKNQTLPKANTWHHLWQKTHAKSQKEARSSPFCHHFSGAFAISLSRKWFVNQLQTPTDPISKIAEMSLVTKWENHTFFLNCWGPKIFNFTWNPTGTSSNFGIIQDPNCINHHFSTDVFPSPKNGPKSAFKGSQEPSKNQLKERQWTSFFPSEILDVSWSGIPHLLWCLEGDEGVKTRFKLTIKLVHLFWGGSFAPKKLKRSTFFFFQLLEI